MTAYVSLFLTVFLIAAVAVFAYRRLSSAQAFKRIEIDIPAMMAWAGRKIRQGLPMRGPASRERVKQVKLRTPKGGLKMPWGW